jgi:hypothetical protein
MDSILKLTISQLLQHNCFIKTVIVSFSTELATNHHIYYLLSVATLQELQEEQDIVMDREFCTFEFLWATSKIQ